MLIFQYYHERHCGKCHSIPQEISICLLCGTIVCLKQNCCKQMNVCEAIQVSKVYIRAKAENNGLICETEIHWRFLYPFSTRLTAGAELAYIS